MSQIFDLELKEFLEGPATLGGLVSYLTGFAFPLFIHDDILRSVMWTKARLEAIPRPLANKAAVVELVYGEIADLARSAGTRVYVVELSWTSQTPETDRRAVEGHGIDFVPTSERLWSALPDQSQATFYRHYAHWAGDPPMIVDRHPNQRAHRLIAQQIIGLMNEGVESPATPRFRSE